MNEENLEINESNNIKNLIYEMRGKQVMLDSDLAKLYKCANGTRSINLAVKRNIDRFPERFCFQLTKEEYKKLISKFLMFQNETSKNDNRGGRQKLPYVFTEQGIAMLASVLKTSIASTVSINIMDAFVEMRRFIVNNAQVFTRLTNIEYKLIDHDKKFDELFNELQKDKNFKQKIFFNGQIYDAYSLLVDIIKSAEKKIVIIDNYIDKTVLYLLSKKNDNVKVTIITNEKSILSNLDIKKFNEQYPKLGIKYSNEYHDRFIIIDDDIIYHCGASLKDLGNKIFAINKMEDKTILNKLFSNNI